MTLVVSFNKSFIIRKTADKYNGELSKLLS